MMLMLSALCFAFMNVCVRMAGDLPVFQKSLFRNLVSLIIALTVMLRNGESLLPDDRRNLPFLLIRATAGSIGILCNFYAVDHLLLANASVLNKMAPFCVILFSAVLLKEKLKLPQVLMLTGAFGGALLVVKPVLSNMELVPSLVGFASGVFAGLAYTMVRLLGQRGERGSYIVFFFSAFSCAVVLPGALLTWVPLTAGQLLALAGTGVCAAGGQFCITAAYRYAPGREISLYDYSQVVFAAILGLLFFGDIPDVLSLLGYFLIFAMAGLNFWYNKHPKTP